jgi:soluble lytic murein transglycosylase-like protein
MYALLAKYGAAAGLVITGLHYVSNGVVAGEQAAERWAKQQTNEVVQQVADRLGFVREEQLEHYTAQDLAEKEAVLAGINPSVVRALMKVESGNKSGAISSKGAIGLMQVMAFNAKRCRLDSPALLFRDDLNVKCGVQILKEELQANGWNLDRALQSYNGGAQCIGKCEESVKHSRLVLAELTRDLR